MFYVIGPFGRRAPMEVRSGGQALVETARATLPIYGTRQDIMTHGAAGSERTTASLSSPHLPGGTEGWNLTSVPSALAA